MLTTNAHDLIRGVIAMGDERIRKEEGGGRGEEKGERREKGG